MNFLDAWGLEAGDTFARIEDAVKDFGETYNDDSIRRNIEIGATIYRNSQGQYYYPTPNDGVEAEVLMYTPPLNQNDTAVHLTHTHGSSTQHKNEELSAKDIETSELYKLPVTAVTPGGNITGYNPATDTDFNCNDPKIPSDPNSGSDRKTNVDPASGQDNPRVPIGSQQPAPPPPSKPVPPQSPTPPTAIPQSPTSGPIGGKQEPAVNNDQCNYN